MVFRRLDNVLFSGVEICSICPHFERSGIFSRLKSVQNKRALVTMTMQSILSTPLISNPSLLSSHFSQPSQPYVPSSLKKFRFGLSAALDGSRVLRVFLNGVLLVIATFLGLGVSVLLKDFLMTI